LVSATATTATEYFLVMWLWDFLFGDLSLEKDELSWLSVGSSVAYGIILSRKGCGSWGWLHAYGCVTIVILSMVKREIYLIIIIVTDNILTGDVNQLYRTTAHEEDYFNPTAYGMLSCRSISSCASDFDRRLENWQQRLHELSTRRCARMTRALRWVGIKVREPPTFYGLNDLEEFFMKYEI
jgi:hypothetical protein